MPLTHPLILASASPRRRELLREAGYHFQVVPPPIEEPPMPPTAPLTASAWAEALAYFKARAVADLHPKALVVGADTIVAREHHIIGKPRDRADARRILTSLFAGPSEVITGLAVIAPPPTPRIITHVCSIIVMRPMDHDELEHYLDSGAWRDKAGAYALQEGGDRFVQSIQGSISNIVGLPMEQLQHILTHFQK